MVSRSPDGAAFSGQTAVQLREIMAQKIFLVTGATGATGGYAVEQLLERGHAVQALAHREDDRSKRLQELGAEVVTCFASVCQTCVKLKQARTPPKSTPRSAWGFGQAPLAARETKWNSRLAGHPVALRTTIRLPCHISCLAFFSCVPKNSSWAGVVGEYLRHKTAMVTDDNPSTSET